MKMMKEVATAQTTWMISREGPIVADAAAQATTGTIQDSNKIVVFDMVASFSTSLQVDGWRTIETRRDAAIEYRGIHTRCGPRSCRVPAG